MESSTLFPVLATFKTTRLFVIHRKFKDANSTTLMELARNVKTVRLMKSLLMFVPILLTSKTVKLPQKLKDFGIAWPVRSVLSSIRLARPASGKLITARLTTTSSVQLVFLDSL